VEGEADIEGPDSCARTVAASSSPLALYIRYSANYTTLPTIDAEQQQGSILQQWNIRFHIEIVLQMSS